MKKIRFLLKLLSGLFLLLLAAVILLLLMPSAQTALARPWIPADPGVSPKLDYLKVSFGGIEARGFSTRLSNVDISLTDVSARFSLWKLLLSQQAHITSAHVQGAKIDLSEAPPAPPPVSSEPRSTPAPSPRSSSPTPSPEKPVPPSEPKTLPSLNWPAALSIDELTVDAQVVLDNQQNVTLQLKGKDLKPDASGQLQYNLTYRNNGNTLPITTGDIEGSLQTQIDSQGELQNVTLKTRLAATGPDFLEPIRFDLFLHSPKLSSHALQLQLTSPDLPANSPQPLHLDVSYQEQQQTLVGSFAIALNSKDWASRLPENLRQVIASIQGKGDFRFSPESQTGELQSTGSIHASGLEQIVPNIPDFARKLEANWEVSAAAASQELHIRSLELQAKLPASGTALTLSPSAPLTIPFSDPGATLDKSPLPPFQLSFDNLSPDLIQAFLPADMQIQFQPINGQAEITLHSLDSFELRMPSSLFVRGLQVSGPSLPVIQPVDLSLAPTVHYQASAIQASWKLQMAPRQGSNNNGLGIHLQWEGKGQWKENVFSLQHQLTALLNQLQSLSPELASVQSVSIQSQATLEGEIQEQGLKVQIQKLDNRIGQGNQTWFSLGSPAPWSLQTHKEQSLPEFRDLQIELQLHNLPLPLMRAFVPDLQANASSSKGRFLLQSRGKGWVLQNPEPLSLQQFSLNWNQEPWLQGVNATLAFNGSLDAQQQLQVQIPTFAFSSTRGELLSLQGKLAAHLADQQEIPWEFDVAANANLALAREQPLLRTFLENVMSGQSRITAKGRYQKQLQVEGQIDAQNIRGTTSTTPQNLSSRFNVQFDPVRKNGQIRLPVSVTSGRQTSSLALDAQFQLPGEQQTTGNLQANIRGEELYVSDLMSLLDTFKPTQTTSVSTPAPATSTSTRPSLTGSTRAANVPATSPARTTPPATTPDTQAVWAGWNGKIDLAVQKILLPNGDLLQDLQGKVNLTNNRAAIESLTGKLNGAPASLQAAIDFIPNNPNPYRTSGKLSIQNLDTYSFFKDTAKPLLNTRLNASGAIQGSAPTLNQIVDTLQGNLQVDGKEGVFRAFAGQPALNTAASVIGGLGQVLFGNNNVLPPELRALERLSSILSEIPFREIRFEAVRGENLDIQMKEIRITGNDVQLSGQGRVTNQAGIPILQQPLSMAFQMDMRGTTADIFQQAKLLKALPEGVSPQQFRTLDFPMQISGSLGSVDTSQIWDRLLNEVTNMISPEKKPASGQPSNTNPQRSPVEDVLRGIFR